jgi:hypothetical protein
MQRWPAQATKMKSLAYNIWKRCFIRVDCQPMKVQVAQKNKQAAVLLFVSPALALLAKMQLFRLCLDKLLYLISEII